LAQGAQAFVELLREIDRFDLARLHDGPLTQKSILFGSGRKPAGFMSQAGTD